MGRLHRRRTGLLRVVAVGVKVGKLLGKVLGEVIAAPLTIAAEVVETTESAIDQTGKAITRGWDQIEGEKK